MYQFIAYPRTEALDQWRDRGFLPRAINMAESQPAGRRR
jgi:hypothetical protein